MSVFKKLFQFVEFKSLISTSAPMRTHHYLLGGFTTIALVVTYIVINTPSASTDPSATSSPSAVDSFVIENANDSDLIINYSDRLVEPNTHQNATNKSTTEIDSTSDSTSMAKIDAADSVADTATTVDQDAGLVETAEPIIIDPILAYLETQSWASVEVKKNDTLSQIFNRVDLDSREAYAIANLESAAPLLKIRPGDELKMKKMPDGAFGQLQYQLNKFETLLVTHSEGGFIVDNLVREPEVRINNAKAIISNSLLGAAGGADVSYKIMYEFIAMFGWQVDFSMDLRKGDQFSLIFEEHYLDDKKVGDGQIIAAELIVSEKKLRAIRHVDEDGFVDFFSPNGDGIKGTFLRSPLKFGHITSNFSKNRLHPIKKTWRAHKGVDYGAPRGTPIMATGNGTVSIAGTKNGYGKTVVIRHGGKYHTLYAHLSGYAKGIKSGTRLNQGDIIGYVGSTGLATGPHLHYEFRINGVHKNPVTVEFPKSAPIEDKYRPQFEKIASIWVSELDHLQQIPLASKFATN